LQLLAGMWTFVRHNTFAAVALGFYGAFWISYWALNTFYLSRIPAAEQNSALGLFLIFWAVFSFYIWTVSFRVNFGVMLVFLTLWPAYLLLGLGTVNASSGLTHIGGAFGVATALLAWCVSFAETLHNTIGKAVAPLVPFGSKVVDEPPRSVRQYQPVAGKPAAHNRSFVAGASMGLGRALMERARPLTVRYPLIVVAGVAIGAQSAAVRASDVRGVNTTFMTSTLTVRLPCRSRLSQR
jgi:GPR1/FUN34/yaaH family